MEQSILNFINNVYNTIGWPGVVLLMTLESACIPIPSELIMPLAGWMLIQSAGHGPGFIVLAAFCGGIGNVLGSLIAYCGRSERGRPSSETLRQIYSDFQPRPGARQSMVRQIRRLDHIFGPLCSGGQDLHQPAGRHRADECRQIHLLRFCRLFYLVGRLSLRRLSPRPELGENPRGYPAVRLPDPRRLYHPGDRVHLATVEKPAPAQRKLTYFTSPVSASIPEVKAARISFM